MSWQGSPDVLKDKLAEAGADRHRPDDPGAALDALLGELRAACELGGREDAEWRAWICHVVERYPQPFIIGPDLMEPIAGEPMPPAPVVPVLGGKLVVVRDEAEYYVNGEARKVVDLLAGAPQGVTTQPVSDVIVVADVAEALREREAACTCTLSAGNIDPVGPWERDPECPVHVDG